VVVDAPAIDQHVSVVFTSSVVENVGLTAIFSGQSDITAAEA